MTFPDFWISSWKNCFYYSTRCWAFKCLVGVLWIKNIHNFTPTNFAYLTYGVCLYPMCEHAQPWPLTKYWRGAQWLGRAINWGSKGCLFENHCRRNHCIVSLSKTLYFLFCTGLIQEESKFYDVNDNCWLGCKSSKQTKQNFDINLLDLFQKLHIKWSL